VTQTLNGAGGLVRVTVVAGERKEDLALPGSLPVAELLPELVRLVGLLDAQTAHAGYSLVTPNGRRLTGDRGLTLQGVEDGGVLTVTSGLDAEPPRVYDDIVEAMADAVEQDMRPWEPAAGRRTALSSAALLLGLGALALAFQRPDLAAGAAAGVAAVVLVAAALVLSRVQREHEAALVLAWAGVVYAVVCGLTAAPAGPLLEAPAALAGAGAVLAGLVSVTGLVERRALMIPAIGVGAVCAAASGIATVSSFPADAVYTVALVVVVLAGSALPWLALGATSTRVDQAHSDADITGQPQEVHPDQVRRDARLGHEVLLGVTATVGLLIVVVSPLAVRLGVTGALVVVCASAVLMLRTRQYRVGSEVATGLAWGVGGPVATAISIVVEQPTWHVVLALVLTVAGAVLLVVTLVPSSPSVRRGRWGDVAELVALVAMLPLLVFATGLVAAVGS
jgi:type VII secretion integral membrane protein EccD